MGERAPSTSRTCGASPGGLVWWLRSRPASGCSGTLSIALSERRKDFGPHDVALVKELARRASTAIENARLYSERTYIAETLQRSLLPASLPSVEGFDLAADLPACRGWHRGRRRLL